MLIDHRNYKHAPLKCPLCKTNKNVLKDEYHGEIFCSKCGTVIQDICLIRITQVIKNDNYQDEYIKRLWRKKIKVLTHTP